MQKACGVCGKLCGNLFYCIEHQPKHKMIKPGPGQCGLCDAPLIRRINRTTKEEFMGCPNWKVHRRRP